MTMNTSTPQPSRLNAASERVAKAKAAFKLMTKAMNMRDTIEQARLSNTAARMHGGNSLGSPKGSQNALKHGRYTANAISERRQVRKLLRRVRALIVTII